MFITLNDTKEKIDVEGKEFYKYWNVQHSLYKNCGFFMASDVEQEYDGYVLNYVNAQGKTVYAFYWHDTIIKFGEKLVVPNKFNNLPIYRINVDYKDGVYVEE